MYDQANIRKFDSSGEDAMPTEESVAMSEENVSEQEQVAYDSAVSKGMKYMYGPGADNVLKILGSAKNPAQGIGQVTAMIAKQLHTSSEDQGQSLPDGVLFAASQEIAESALELGTEAGVFEFDNEGEAQEQVDQGFMWALKIYGEQGLADGTLDEEALAEEGQRPPGQNTAGVNPQVAQAVNQAVSTPQQGPAGAGIISGRMGG